MPSGSDKVTLSDADVTALEAAIDTQEAKLAPLRAFILPGGMPAAAQLHLAAACAAEPSASSSSWRRTNRFAAWCFATSTG